MLHTTENRKTWFKTKQTKLKLHCNFWLKFKEVVQQMLTHLDLDLCSREKGLDYMRVY